MMAVRLLLDAGIPARGSTIALLCDNPFEPYLVRGLESCGAVVASAPALDRLRCDRRPDAVLVSLRPRAGTVVGGDEAAEIARRWPGVTVAQLWGDIDRAALAAHGLQSWPVEAPGHGHMAVLPSDLGPDPIVRLQAGGLKVGAVLLVPRERRTEHDRAFLDEL
jgi:hypothetical protein